MEVGENVQYEILNTLGPHPIISIRVDSPGESPKQEHPPHLLTAISPDDVNEPIDVNLPRDTRNIFYDFPHEQQTEQDENTENHS